MALTSKQGQWLEKIERAAADWAMVSCAGGGGGGGGDQSSELLWRQSKTVLDRSGEHTVLGTHDFDFVTPYRVLHRQAAT
jgi:hypothetical protein